jgi:hypothetical protein
MSSGFTGNDRQRPLSAGLKSFQAQIGGLPFNRPGKKVLPPANFR